MLGKMVESGELQKTRAKWAAQGQDCGGGKGRPLGFENTSPAFLIFLAGLTASWVVLLLEMVVDKMMRGQERDKQDWVTVNGKIVQKQIIYY